MSWAFRASSRTLDRVVLRIRAFREALGALPGLALLAWSFHADDAWYEAHMTPGYCAENTSQLARLHAARWIAAALGLLFLVVVRPRLVRWLGGLSLVSAVGSALRILLAVALAVVVSDVVLRRSRLRAARLATPLPPSPNHLGPQVIDTVIANRKVHYATNADGFRTRTPEDVVDRAARTIVFSGESVVFGYGVDYDDSIPALVAAGTGVPTINLGVCASSNDQALARLERFLPSFPNTVAVVTFVVYDWLYRNVEPMRERLALGWDGALERIPAEPELVWSSPVWGTLRSIYHAEDAGALTRAILRRTAEVVRSRGAYPLFVFTQSRAWCMSTSSKGPALLRRLADDQPFPLIEMNLDPSMSLEGDLHPSPRGTAQYAAAITRALKDGGVLEAR